jgi:cysteinyl-tRNA synthetase
MTLSLHDTMTRAKRVFTPQDPRRVTMYVCGPTVYNFSHIGNFRPVVVFDLLFRVLRDLYGDDAVVYAANVTDVDDKINAKAMDEGVPIATITDRYLTAYNADMAALGSLAPSVQPRVTETMQAIVAMIGRLEGNGSAYAAEGHVLFDTQAFPGYGALSGRPLEDMIAGARVDVAPYKRHPADFVLWKPSKPGEPQWESPWGPGRPGWHIECSAMIEQVLGLPIDIHGGGIDLVFPHHENERAQGLCADRGHEEYARFWLHNGFLNMGDEKMSKSLGNVALAHDLLKQYPGEAIRWALLAGHYRAPLEWTAELIGQAQSALDRLYRVLHDADAFLKGRSPAGAGAREHSGARKAHDQVLAALHDDLNTPAAFAAIHQLAGLLRAAILAGDVSGAEDCHRLLLEAGQLMGFFAEGVETWFKGAIDGDVKARIEGLIAARDAARTGKDWGEADRIRAELTALNVEVMDGPAGATWRIREQA